MGNLRHTSKWHRVFDCECKLDLDGFCGQVAIAQKFIDCWYFAQPSPGQQSFEELGAMPTFED